MDLEVSGYLFHWGGLHKRIDVRCYDCDAQRESTQRAETLLLSRFEVELRVTF